MAAPEDTTEIKKRARRRFLLRLYEVMLVVGLLFATVPFIRSCLSAGGHGEAGASIRLSQVSIGGTLRVPGDSADQVLLIHRFRDTVFHVFALYRQADGGLFPTASGASCERVRVAYNRVECSRGAEGFSWDFRGTPSLPGEPSLKVVQARVDGDRLYYGAGL